MLTRRNLRSKIREKETVELKRNGKISTKGNLNDKENRSKKIDLIKNNKLRDKRTELLYSSVLKNSKSRPVKSTVSKKKNCENGYNNGSSKQLVNEDLRKRTCRRQSIRQSSLYERKLSVLKENNFNVKNKKSVNLSKKLQNRDIKNAREKGIKMYFKPISKMKSYLIENNQPKKYANQENVCKKKCSNTAKNAVNQNANFPVWKKMIDLNKSKHLKNQNSKQVDVYDMSLDAEFMADKVRVQKKQIHPQKRKVGKDAFKKNGHILSAKNRTLKTNHSLKTNSKRAIQEDQITSHAVNKKIASIEKTEKSPSHQLSQQNEILEDPDFDLPPPELEPRSNNKFLSDLAEELEKSFEIPKMMSTPDTNHGKNKMPSTKNHTSETNYHPSSDNLNVAFKRPIQKVNHITSHAVIKKITLVKGKENMPSDQTRASLLPSTSVNLSSQQNETFQHSNSDGSSSEDKSHSSTYLSDLANELERSFQIPKMTSTPAITHGKNGTQVKKGGIVNIKDISRIAPINKNVTVEDINNITLFEPPLETTPSESTYETNILKDKKEKVKGKKKKKKDLDDITLFEPPLQTTPSESAYETNILKYKKEKVKGKKKKDLDDITLFESPASTSVLKPKKAYTPDQCRVQLARIKRLSEISKKEEKASKEKEEMFIEKMTQHFDAVQDTELCIE